MTTILIAALVLAVVILAAALALAVRSATRANDRASFAELGECIETAGQTQARAYERLERELRGEITETSRLSRAELGGGFAQFQQTLAAQLTSVATMQNQQIEGFATRLAQLTETNAAQLDAMRESLQRHAHESRDEQASALKRFGDTLAQQLAQLVEANDRRFAEVRTTLEARLKDIEANNATKLDEMRRTVDEKLHATLEQRLGESFKLVSDRLEQVHRGLGEMQALAQGVGDLKKVLTNVKTRGTWGEVQLEMLLEQMLTPEQYDKNVETVHGTGARVEFAIRLPGKTDADHDATVWLPIDAKFPKEQYERLLDAQERADADAAATASRELEVAVRKEAQTIHEKYIAPPATTDFAILFLPTEGLYAEVLRRPGLTDELQRKFRVTVAGPTTLTAILNSLQMGFRTLALEKRSSEVWQVLGAVKSEFGKFGDVLAATKKTLERAVSNIEQAEVRTRQMNRKLKAVEALPSDSAQSVLGLETAVPQDDETEAE